MVQVLIAVKLFSLLFSVVLSSCVLFLVFSRNHEKTDRAQVLEIEGDLNVFLMLFECGEGD